MKNNNNQNHIIIIIIIIIIISAAKAHLLDREYFGRQALLNSLLASHEDELSCVAASQLSHMAA